MRTTDLQLFLKLYIGFIMKSTLSVLLLISALVSDAQVVSWKQVQVNAILSFSLPVEQKSVQTGGVKSFFAKSHSNIYGLQYYDSIFKVVDNEGHFRASLLGFISGRSTDSMLKGYRAIVKDTTIGGTAGLMAIYSSNDSSRFYKAIYYYVTMANDHYYWFYTYTSFAEENKAQTDYFFGAIKFEAEKLKERNFKLGKVYLQKDRL